MPKSKPCLKSLNKNLSDGTLKPGKIKLEVFLDLKSKKGVKFQKKKKNLPFLLKIAQIWVLFVNNAFLIKQYWSTNFTWCTFLRVLILCYFRIVDISSPETGIPWNLWVNLQKRLSGPKRLRLTKRLFCPPKSQTNSVHHWCGPPYAHGAGAHYLAISAIQVWQQLLQPQCPPIYPPQHYWST